MEHKYKIAFMISSLGLGGAERVISNIANRFSLLNDWQVYFIVKNHAEEEYELYKGIRRIDLFQISNKRKSVIGVCKQVLAVRRFCKKNKIDILVNFLAASNIKGLLATLGIATKCIVCVRDDPNAEYGTLILRMLSKILFPFATGVVFQTSEEAQWFSKKIIKKGAIIPNPVNEKFYLSDCEYFNIKNRMDIVAVGRLEIQKNHIMLLEAFKKIKTEFPDEKLSIYGKGTQYGKLKLFIEQNGLNDSVSLMGAVQNIQDYVKKAKIFVMTSNHEGIPNAMLEAMALGVPVICTDCPAGGPREYIENGKDGILITMRDVDGLVSALRQLLSNKDLCYRIGNAAREKAKMFSEDVVFDIWKKYIMSCIKV